MLQGFRAYKERRNPNYNEEVMTCRSFATEPAMLNDVKSEIYVRAIFSPSDLNEYRRVRLTESVHKENA